MYRKIGNIYDITVSFNLGKVINTIALTISIESFFADGHCSMRKSKAFLSHFSSVLLRAFNIMHVSSAYCLMTSYV